MQKYWSIVLLLVLALVTLGCAGMSPTEQRILSGGALGAGAGAAIGAATGGNPAAGAAIGGAAGAVGGAIVDQMERSRRPDADQGYYEKRESRSYYNRDSSESPPEYTPAPAPAPDSDYDRGYDNESSSYYNSESSRRESDPGYYREYRREENSYYRNY